MKGKTWYRLPARLLREEKEDNEIAAAVQRAGPKPVSDGRLETLVQDDRLLRPDALSFGEPGWLCIAVNQLHRAPAINGGVEGAERPFRILRFCNGTTAIAGR